MSQMVKLGHLQRCPLHDRSSTERERPSAILLCRTSATTADSYTAMKPMRIITDVEANRRSCSRQSPLRDDAREGLISRLKGDFANKSFRTPVETRFAL
jgi:hypothetical protein